MELRRSNFERRLLEAFNYSKEEIELSMNPKKSDYQKNLEAHGWELIARVKAKNRLMDYTETRKYFRFLREDCRREYCPGRKTRLFRAHDKYGERIPSRKKIVGVYARDRE
ncbi:MAG: hypothetical protein IIA85_01585 [Nanoarchaeota archaeon]|nr:hypothetical protein [Nanoarchaeota archaeon]